MTKIGRVAIDQWKAVPFIIRKADGGFLYGTSDLATIDYRVREWKADEIWYVVGVPQQLHFRQLFEAAHRRGEILRCRKPAGVQFRIAARQEDRVAVRIGGFVGKRREERDLGPGGAPVFEHGRIGENEGGIAGDRNARARRRQRRTTCRHGIARGSGGFDEPDAITNRIGENVAGFLADEIKVGRLPASFLPLQSGVGNIANAVIGALGSNPGIPPFMMYTEVLQDSVVNLLQSGKCAFASSCSLTLSPARLKEFYANLEYFRSRVVLRRRRSPTAPRSCAASASSR